MKQLIPFIFVLASLAASSSKAQLNFSDYGDYCRTMSEVASTTLVARTRGMPRSVFEEQKRAMTDPRSIRMVGEVIEFAFSRPATTPIGALRTELVTLCLAKKIFVQ